MYDNKIKELVIKHHNRGLSYRQISDLLDISKSIAHYWINYKYKPKSNKTFDLNKLVQSVKLFIDKNKFIIIREIAKKLNYQFKINFSNSLVYTIIIKQLEYSYKKVSEKLYSSNLSELLKRKKEFKDRHKNYKNIICIDETFVYSNIYKKYGWSKKGDRLCHYIKSNPIKYSIILAISCFGIEHYKLLNENVNKHSYLQFITKLSKKHTGKKFLMDNVSFHKCKEIKDVIIKYKNEILFIPPYSPELNPIEEVFSMFKSKLVRSSKKQIINNIKNLNFENYYKHSFGDNII